jgi:hypothetical protein
MNFFRARSRSGHPRRCRRKRRKGKRIFRTHGSFEEKAKERNKGEQIVAEIVAELCTEWGTTKQGRKPEETV